MCGKAYRKAEPAGVEVEEEADEQAVGDSCPRLRRIRQKEAPFQGQDWVIINTTVTRLQYNHEFDPKDRRGVRCAFYRGRCINQALGPVSSNLVSR